MAWHRATAYAILAWGCLGAACSAPPPGSAPLLGDRLVFGTGEVFYTDGIDPVAARSSGEVLVRLKYFADRPTTVQLRYRDRRYEARFVVKAGGETGTAADRDWRRIGALLSKECFRSSPVDVHLCDERLATLRVVPFEPLRPALPIRLTFRPSAAGGSLVAQYRNDTVRHLALAVGLANPTTGASSRFTLTVAPGGVTEHGWAEGWSYRSGDTVDVAHADYETQHFAVP